MWKYDLNQVEPVAIGGRYLPVWKLEPLDAEHRNWKASTYQGTVIIRAPNEENARWIAKLAFGVATDRNLGEDTLFSPWGDSTLVGVCQLTTTDHSEEGDEAILDPPEYDCEWRDASWPNIARKV